MDHEIKKRLRELYENNKFIEKLFQFIYLFTCSAEVTWDILQETFLRLAKGPKSYAQILGRYLSGSLDHKSFLKEEKNYIYCIAKRLCITWARRDKRFGKALNKFSKEISTRYPTVSEIECLRDSNTIHILLRLTLILPPVTREVFIQRAFLGLDYIKIASKLSIKPGNARKRFYEARKILKRVLELIVDLDLT